MRKKLIGIIFLIVALSLITYGLVLSDFIHIEPMIQKMIASP